ncbi:MAG: GNAT family N-acetyltransferase [Lachnospiraceae bacterium]|nr:GNAT family N-acetyltransferase [Lachnospiraceae bacterium]
MEKRQRFETERLIMESAHIVDKSKDIANAIHKAGEFEWFYGIKETKERLEMISINCKCFYNIFDREGKFLGYVGFSPEGEDYEVEIYIIKKYRRRGYATECLNRMIREAFLGSIEDIQDKNFTKIVSSVRKENIPSCALMEKCGFENSKAVADLCVLFHMMPDEEPDKMGAPIFMKHYCITREKGLGSI